MTEHTVAHLNAISSYTAQLMEAEGLRGFCFVRKPWREIQTYHRKSLIICAVNPFEIINSERLVPIVEQLAENHIDDLLEPAKRAFHGRLLSLADAF